LVAFAWTSRHSGRLVGVSPVVTDEVAEALGLESWLRVREREGVGVRESERELEGNADSAGVGSVKEGVAAACDTDAAADTRGDDEALGGRVALDEGAIGTGVALGLRGGGDGDAEGCVAACEAVREGVCETVAAFD
jgi:hypothetical protein